MEPSELSNLVGLAFGLLIALFVWSSKSQMSSTMQKEIKGLKEENEDLKNHLGVQMKVNARGNEAIQRENEDLKKQNENLRVTLKALQNKPGKAALKRLYVLEKAGRIMNGFALGGVWDRAISDAEKDIEDANQGIKDLIFIDIGEEEDDANKGIKGRFLRGLSFWLPQGSD